MTTAASAGEIARLIGALRAHVCGCGGECGQRTPPEITQAADALAAAEEEIRQDQEALADLRSALTAAEARIAEMSEAGWQSMETAPKDGTRVLIWTKHGSRHILFWWSAYSPFFRAEIDGWWGSADPGRSILVLPEDATHWRPLPEAPNTNPPKGDEG